MKILLLNTFDQIGGAARASVRLLQGLGSLGVDASLLVREKTISESAVHVTGSRYGGRLRALIDYLPLKFYRHRQLHNFSPAWVASPTADIAKDFSPDVVHLHWVPQGFVQVEGLSRLPCPIVWTLHDFWPFTGGCHLPGGCQRYQEDCGCCPVLGSGKTDDLSRRGWRRKRRSYPIDRMMLVAPSQWMAERVMSSSLLQECQVEVIPNGLDVNVYSPGDKAAAREALGLPQERSVILFGAKSALSDHNKGADLLWEALGRLPAGQRRLATLVVFGETAGTVPPALDMGVVNLGEIGDEARIVALYRAADVFVLPSRQENLPNTVSEAMACGLPCVAFAVGGLPEQIEHRRTGCLVPPYDTQVMAMEISWLIERGETRQELSECAREYAVSHYSLDLVAKRHIELYRRLVRDHRALATGCPADSGIDP